MPFQQNKGFHLLAANKSIKIILLNSSRNQVYNRCCCILELDEAFLDGIAYAITEKIMKYCLYFES